jgi:hypothetical protein
MSYQSIEIVDVQSDISDENSNTDENNSDSSLDLLIMETDDNAIQEEEQIKKSRRSRVPGDSASRRSSIIKKIEAQSAALRAKKYYYCDFKTKGSGISKKCTKKFKSKDFLHKHQKTDHCSLCGAHKHCNHDFGEAQIVAKPRRAGGARIPREANHEYKEEEKENSFKCTFPGCRQKKGFANQQYLNQHMKRHEEKKIKCPEENCVKM